jgi:hypothetical protein
MACTTLPRDVLATIVDAGSFSQYELSTISLVSPHLRYEAQIRLFRNPGAHSINVLADDESFNTTRMFLEAVASSPDRLAPMVRRYHVTLSWYDFRARYEHEKKDLQHRLFNHLSRSLPLMANLKELRYHQKFEDVPDSIPAPSPSIWPVLKRCPFKLRVLCCSYIGTKNRRALAEFLRSQASVQELWICEVPSPGSTNTTSFQRDVFKDACPSLVSLGGMPEIVASMLSGRQAVEHMSWEKNDYVTAVKYTPKLFSMTNVKSVKLMESLRCGPPLIRICELFKNLVVLKTCERDVIQVCLTCCWSLRSYCLTLISLFAEARRAEKFAMPTYTNTGLGRGFKHQYLAG